MTLTEQQVVTLARASAMYGEFAGERSSKPWDERIRSLALDSLGSPGDDDVVTSALRCLGSQDRNLRVAALRVLRWHPGDERVADAVFRATHDDARRVRSVAVRLCAMFVERPGVTERLRAIVEDPLELPRIASVALESLTAAPGGALPETVVRSVTDLLDSDAYRGRVLFLLLRRPLDDSSRTILKEVVRVGTKSEAVAATRGLCGQRIVNAAHYGPKERGALRRTAEPVDVSWVWPDRTQGAWYWTSA